MKNKIIILAFLLITVNAVQAQGKFRVKKLNADSLAALIPEKEGSEKADVLNLLSNVICRKDIDSSISLANEAIELSEELDYQRGLADGYFYLGNCYFLKDSLQPTVSNYLKALRIYENLEPTEELGNLCLQLCVINIFTGRLDALAQYGKLAVRTYTKVNDPEGLYMAYFVSSVNHPPYSLDSIFFYFNKALSYLDPERHQSEMAYVYLEMGEAHWDQFHATGDTSCLTTAVSWLKKASGLNEIHDETRAMVYVVLATVYLDFESDNYTSEGLKYLQMANQIADSCFDAYDFKSFIYEMLGHASYRQGNYKKAISFYEQGIKIIEERLSAFNVNEYREPVLALNFIRFHKLYKQIIYEGLSNTYSALGDYKQALVYFTLSKEAEEETYHEQYQNLFMMLEADSEDEKAEKQIALLASDNELKEIKIRQSRAFNIGIAGLFVILVLMGWLFLRQKKMQVEHKSVILEQKLLRLQMNPHFIFNALSNILNFVNKKDTANAANYLTSFSRLLRSTLESSREDYILLQEEITSIKNYLDLQLLRYAGKFEYSIEVDEAIDIENAIITPMLIQPFIENAIEHGIRHKQDKGHIFIRFRLENKKVICEVEDNGVGREKAWETEYQKQKTHKSLATEIINDRIQALNKKLKQKISLDIMDMKSENNQPAGTLVRLDLPYLVD